MPVQKRFGRARVSRHTVLTHLLPLAGATVLLAVTAAAGWQAWVIGHQGHARDQLHQAKQDAVRGLSGALQARREKINVALTDDSLLAALEKNDAAGRKRAAKRARQLLPHLHRIRFFSPGLDEIITADYAEFGYARAARLMQVQGSDHMPAIGVVAAGGEHWVAWARPVTGAHDDSVLAYAWLDWPLTDLTAAWQSVDPGRGRLSLRNAAAGAGMVLATRGGTDVVADSGNGKLLADSELSLHAEMPRLPILLPGPWWGALFLALLAAAGAVLLWRLRARARDGAGYEETRMSTSADASTESDQAAPATDTAHAPETPAAAPAAADSSAQVPTVAADIFRAYDIRGVVGEQLTAEVARLLGRAIGSEVRARNLSDIVVGRDGRHSGPELMDALTEGLRATGVNVVDVGAVPTPVVYFATHHFDCGSGVAVTGSHNPPAYNGFKIVIGGETLASEAIADLERRIRENDLVDAGTDAETGTHRQAEVTEDYIERIASDVQTERPLKIVVDAGNGIAGELAPRVLEAIGCEVVPLYCEVDGDFPNHHPDPSDPANLEDLEQALTATDSDLGVALDGDGDRLGVVTRDGEIMFPDRLLILFARDVLERDPGAGIIYDVKCTGHLAPEVLRAGGSPLMWRTGHSLIKAKMQETGAALAGEMSGHFFFQERWYGFDDGVYAAARLLEILAGDLDGRPPEAIFATLPKGVATPELKVDMGAEGANHAFVEQFSRDAAFEGARLTTIDGVRADWSDGWGLVRASNTTPVLVLRFDADNAEALERIKQAFRNQLLAQDASLELPF